MSSGESPVPIQGLPVPPGKPIPSRTEFKAWSTNSNNSIPVSLFIQALNLWYTKPYQDQLSYFRIGAIHGYPKNLAWNGVANDSIFCSHGVITFPTWHRPYMLLFEQCLSSLMTEVINDLTFDVTSEKQEWLDAAAEWRLPYWDWGLPTDAGHIPDLFRTESIVIRMPLDKLAVVSPTLTVTNPLNRYLLQTGSPVAPTAMGDLPPPYKVDDVNYYENGKLILNLPWASCAGTSRWGIKKSVDKSEWMLGINNWQSCNAAIDGHSYEDGSAPINGMTVCDLVYRILAPGYAQNWQTFATTGKDRKSLTGLDWVQYLSLEYIHNNLHGFIGGDVWSDGIGHMQNVPSAAFDPIFFMHHANVDRLIATYQTLYPDNWFVPTDNPSSQSALKPFYHEFPGDQTRLFNSDDLRDWTKFGYQYDMLQPEPNESHDQYIARIHAWVKRTYGGVPQLLLDDKNNLFGDDSVTDNTYNDYIIDVIYDRYALGGQPYTISFYLGEVPGEEISTRATALTRFPQFIGNIFNFSTPTVGADGQRICQNCDEQAAAGTLSTGQIPLTATLYKKASDRSFTGLQTFDPDNVEQYLKDHLHWIVVSAEGTVVPIEQLPDTKVFVLKGSARHYDEEDRLSQFQAYSALPRATQNKSGGATEADYNI